MIILLDKPENREKQEKEKPAAILSTRNRHCGHRDLSFSVRPSIDLFFCGRRRLETCLKILNLYNIKGKKTKEKILLETHHHEFHHSSHGQFYVYICNFVSK